MSERRQHFGLVIFVAALGVRVIWVVLQWMRVGPALSYDDESLHWQLATNLVHHFQMVSDDGRWAARMPLYPLFLATFAWMGDAGILAARLTQCMLAAAAAPVAYRLTHDVFGPRPAVVAGVLLAVDPFTIFFSNLLLTEVPFVLIAVGLVAVAWRLIAHADKPGGWTVVGAALLSTAAILMRPSSLGWIVLLWGALWALDRFRVRTLRRVGLCALVFGITLVPWGLRNRAVIGSPAWLSANGGVTLYDAQGPQADGSSNQAFLLSMPEVTRLGEVERDRALYRLAIEQMQRDPQRIVRLARAKFLRTWSLRPNVAEYSGGLTAVVSAVFTGPVLLAAFVGLVRNLRRRPKTLALLWLPIVYFTLLHCIFIGSLRYRIPLMPFVEITAAAAFVSRIAPTAPRQNVSTLPTGA